ncbi:TRAP transporter substrate-binding protein [uncultured Photobacterium sp.]|uniref:TRAP transporter substrate-binding protein n=1 Tax=uncultured Photobacterium sp. TaxID=173973 RepID=UPI002637DBFF|nr:TRAP transporter substrate-binding protein DctP [uncultured Photobacterium sp.]
MQLQDVVRKFAVAAAIVSTLLFPFVTHAAEPEKPEYEWKMVTSWPKNYPGIGLGANELAELINEMSGGRIKVTVYGAGELVKALDVFDAVSSGKVQMGHSAASYWTDKVPAGQFFAAVPFGLTAQEMNSWIYHGGGLELWHEAYAPFGIIPMPAGSTGVQMGGWFNKEIKSIDDLKGLKMRIPGLAGKVLNQLGVETILLPGSEIYMALKHGKVDAAEWIGPYNDMESGLHRVARYYYFPGWHEPGTIFEALINKKAYEKLPQDLQSIVMNATRIVNVNVLAEYTARNNAALERLVGIHKINLLPFPPDVLEQLKEISEQVVAEEAKKDALSQKVYVSYMMFRDQGHDWHSLSEQAYLNARNPQ